VKTQTRGLIQRFGRRCGSRSLSAPCLTPPSSLISSRTPWKAGRSAGIFRAGAGWFLPRKSELNYRMKRQYQPSKIRRKRQHGFLSRNSSRSGRAILRNRRRAGRKRLTPVW